MRREKAVERQVSVSSDKDFLRTSCPRFRFVPLIDGLSISPHHLDSLRRFEKGCLFLPDGDVRLNIACMWNRDRCLLGKERCQEPQDLVVPTGYWGDVAVVLLESG